MTNGGTGPSLRPADALDLTRHDNLMTGCPRLRGNLSLSGKRGDISVETPSDLERSRLLLAWLQARRAVDHCLSDLLAAGPAGERRVREQLELVDDLESRAQQAFVRYRSAAVQTSSDLTGATNLADVADLADWTMSPDRPQLDVVRPTRPGSPPAQERGTDSGPGLRAVRGSQRRHR